MVIRSLLLKHFGKFQDRCLDLQEGINVIYGTNEAGKSTIHTFIRGMLFGIDKQRGRTSFDVYTKYKPLDTPTLYSGEMELNTDEGNFIIKRNFYKEEKSVSIINKDTGREVPYREQRGTCFIEGVTESNYCNTVNIGQQQVVTSKELANRVNDYLMNMSTSKSSEVNVTEAMKELQARRKEIENKQTKQKIHELNLELKEIQTTDFMLKELEKQMLDLEQEKVDLIQEQKNCKVDSTLLQKIEVLESYIREYDLIVEKYHSLKDCMSYYRQVMHQIKSYQEQEKMDKQLMPNESSPPAKKRSSYILLSILGLLGVACTIIISLSKFRMEFVIGMTTLLAAIVIIVGVYARRRKVQEVSQKQQVSQSSPRAPDNKMLMEYQETLRRLQTRMHGQEEDILTYANKIVHMVEVTEENMILLHEEVDKLSKQVNNQRKLIEEKREKERRCSRQLEVIGTKREKFSWEFNRLEESISDYSKKRAMRDDLMEKRKKEEIELTAIEISLQTIQELAVVIHDDFGERLNESISNIANSITQGSCYDIKIDEKLNMKSVKGNNFIPMEYLSTGTVEQMYLALRLVAADLLLKDKKMPILLDDSFAFYDDQRLEETINWLSTMGTRQIIIFTCHNREKQALDRQQIPYHYIEL